MEEIASSSQGKRNEKRATALSTLSNDIVEEIFLRLPVETLIRFTSLSKQWSSTIESHSFTERHLKISERSHVNNPSVMVFSDQIRNTEIGFEAIYADDGCPISFTRLSFPLGFFGWLYVSKSCNGLFCIQSSKSNYVVNPATRWLRPLPLARFQILNPNATAKSIGSYAAFVKALDYKLVWLYNVYHEFIPNEGVTKCEVFDFRANAWRFLTCIPSYRVSGVPESWNGSVYWFTEPDNKDDIKVIAFDIHTEKFRLLPKISSFSSSSTSYNVMCTLDNRLCILTSIYHLYKEIWRLKSSDDTWENIYTIGFIDSPLSWLRNVYAWKPVAVCKNTKILLSHPYSGKLVIFDLDAESVRVICPHPHVNCVPYFQSLISHI